MSVSIEGITLAGVGGSTTPQTSFSDNFNRANDGNGLGNDWITKTYIPAANNVATAQISGNRVQLTNTAISGFNVGIQLLPRKVMTGLFGRNQFAQWTLTSDNSAGANQARAGPAVMLVEVNGYVFEPAIDTTNFFIRRCNFPSDTVLDGPFGTAAVGDILRVEVTMTATANTIVCKQNGTTIRTFVDNAPTVILAGIPGLHWSGESAPVTQTWDDFSCGPL